MRDACPRVWGRHIGEFIRISLDSIERQVIKAVQVAVSVHADGRRRISSLLRFDVAERTWYGSSTCSRRVSWDMTLLSARTARGNPNLWTTQQIEQAVTRDQRVGK